MLWSLLVLCRVTVMPILSCDICKREHNTNDNFDNYLINAIMHTSLALHVDKLVFQSLFVFAFIRVCLYTKAIKMIFI